MTPPKVESVKGPARDLEGYAWGYPDPKWPNGAKLAINLVVNFEEGSEASFHHGDNVSEVVLTDGARSFGADKKKAGRDDVNAVGLEF